MAETPQTCSHGLSFRVLCPACTFTPAAPSVGEPEPSELTEYDRGDPETSPHCVCGHRLDRHLHTLPAGTLPCLSMLCWCSSFRAADPVPDRPPTLDDFARLLALGATAKGTYLTPDQSLALRSSLEEARKDSVRLRAAVEGLPRWDIYYDYSQTGITKDPEGDYITRADVLALFAPHAPSARGEA